MPQLIIKILLLLILTIIFAVVTSLILINIFDSAADSTSTGALGEVFDRIVFYLLPSLLGWGAFFWLILFKVL